MHPFRRAMHIAPTSFDTPACGEPTSPPSALLQGSGGTDEWQFIRLLTAIALVEKMHVAVQTQLILMRPVGRF